MEQVLKRHLGLLDVFCLATGAMISSGLFILPGLAFAKAGPAIIVSYALAGIFCIPTVLSKAELTTAMPKAGGDYYYIMRGLGPLLGTIAGFSAWFSLSLKGSFALIGMGAYLSLVTNASPATIALWCCLFFVLINLMGVKEAGKVQVVLVFGLLAVLLAYICWGLPATDSKHFTPFFQGRIGSVFGAASFVFISYGGLTKVDALAGETKNPGRNLPLGMFLSLIVTSILYLLVIYVTIGVLDPGILRNTLTPISDGARVFSGTLFQKVVGIGAFLAFVSTANSSIMSASRYPMGMSTDKLLPSNFQKVNSRSVPYLSIAATGVFMIAAILFLRLELLVKVASTMLILLYILANVTVLLFRKSKIWSYQPKFRAPFYPYLQLLGIAGGILLLLEMGTFTIFLTMIFTLLSIVWYKAYVQKKVTRDSALLYVLETLLAKDKEIRSDDLALELRNIVVDRDKIKEKELYKNVLQQKFFEAIEQSEVMDIQELLTAEDFFKNVSELLSRKVDIEYDKLFAKFVEREKTFSAVIRKGIAIPHLLIKGKNVTNIILVRAKTGIVFPEDKVVHTAFVVVSSVHDRRLHLKALADIVRITQDEEFSEKWLAAKTQEEFKKIIIGKVINE